MSFFGRVRRIARPWIVSQFALALVTSQLHAQMVSPHGIPTEPQISGEEQAGIDEDIGFHYGDVPKDPGPKAKLSAVIAPAAVHEAMKKVADWELERAQPYDYPYWTWSVLNTGFMAASRELKDPRYSDAMLALAEKYHWQLGVEDPKANGWPDNNDQGIGQTYLELYFLKPDPAKIAATRKALDGLFDAPNPPVPEDQFQILWWWCDTLFMGPGNVVTDGSCHTRPKISRLYRQALVGDIGCAVRAPVSSLLSRQRVFE